MKKLPGTDPVEDMMRAVGGLFCRLHERNLAERPRFVLEPAEGVNYRVTAILGRPWGTADGKEAAAVAVGPGPEGAVLALRDMLAGLLRERIKSDVGALELAGLPFDWAVGYGARAGDDAVVVPAEAAGDGGPGRLALGGAAVVAGGRKG